MPLIEYMPPAIHLKVKMKLDELPVEIVRMIALRCKTVDDARDLILTNKAIYLMLIDNNRGQKGLGLLKPFDHAYMAIAARHLRAWAEADPDHRAMLGKAVQGPNGMRNLVKLSMENAPAPLGDLRMLQLFQQNIAPILTARIQAFSAIGEEPGQLIYRQPKDIWKALHNFWIYCDLFKAEADNVDNDEGNIDERRFLLDTRLNFLTTCVPSNYDYHEEVFRTIYPPDLQDLLCIIQSGVWNLPGLRRRAQPSSVLMAVPRLKWLDNWSRRVRHSGFLWMQIVSIWNGVDPITKVAMPSQPRKWINRIARQARVAHPTELAPWNNDLRYGIGLDKAYQWHSLFSDIMKVADRHGPCCVGCVGYPVRAKNKAVAVKVSLPPTCSRLGCDGDSQASNQQEDERRRRRTLSRKGVVAISAQSKRPLRL